VVGPQKALGILAVATLVCLTPFVDKAFCIDDPLFLWAAEQIQSHPLDFYGRQVNWFGTETPLYDATKNPPLTSYYLALVTALVGWNEPPLHATFFLPAIGAIWGTWYLARSFCRQPVSAALVVLATPAFLVSSTNLMCDTMLLCFWTWAIALWIQGLNSKDGRWLSLGSLLIAAAALTKYFGLSLLPLIAVYTIVRNRKPTWQLAWLLLPIALLTGYQWWTWHRYGRGLLSDAAVYSMNAPTFRGSWLEVAVSKTVVALSFTGGSLIPVLFCAPWLLTRRGLLATAGLAVAIILCVQSISSRQQLAALHMSQKFTWPTAVQLGLMTTCGVLVVWLAVSPFLKDRTPDACLWALWVLGTFVFAGFVNWTCNVRSLLPMAPAVGILLAQRAETEDPRRWSWPVHHWQWALAPAAATALLVGWADMSLANSARTAAMQIAGSFSPLVRTVWFQGHWGFQYYMRLSGGREVDLSNFACDPGDVMVYPFNNTNSYDFPREAVGGSVDTAFPVCGWLSTLQAPIGADFYSAEVGPMPFVFGPVAKEKYTIWRIVRPLRSRKR
jgi:4-amino-4-deoxy-L-arabinose transferase-like glycosyltransferase